MIYFQKNQVAEPNQNKREGGPDLSSFQENYERWLKMQLPPSLHSVHLGIPLKMFTFENLKDFDFEFHVSWSSFVGRLI